MIKLKDVVWGEIDFVDEFSNSEYDEQINNRVVMMCCGGGISWIAPVGPGDVVGKGNENGSIP